MRRLSIKRWWLDQFALFVFLGFDITTTQRLPVQQQREKQTRVDTTRRFVTFI